MFAFIETDNEYYRNIEIGINSIPEDINIMDNHIENIDNAHKRLVFALGFLNILYLQHYVPGFNFTPYEK